MEAPRCDFVVNYEDVTEKGKKPATCNQLQECRVCGYCAKHCLTHELSFRFNGLLPKGMGQK